jgi:trimeric autotransporter adhesin
MNINLTIDKSTVGLQNVDNTADLNKPISTAAQTALNLKYDASNPSNFVDANGAALAAPVKSVQGKTGIVVLDKSEIGLGNVDNTSDLNKEISTAAQTALNNKVDKVTGKQLSTEDYTTAEKSKLAGIESGAQVNAVNSVNGKTGTVTLVKDDISLSNVDNTSDANKPISTAQAAVNAVKIGNDTDTYSSPKVFYVITLTQAEYTAIGTKNANTLYIIV